MAMVPLILCAEPAWQTMCYGWADSANPAEGSLTLKWRPLVYRGVTGAAAGYVFDLRESPDFAEMDEEYDFSQELTFEIRRKHGSAYESKTEHFFDDAKVIGTTKAIGTTQEISFTDYDFGKEPGIDMVMYQVKAIGKCRHDKNETWSLTATIETRYTICLAYGLSRFNKNTNLWPGGIVPEGHAHARYEVDDIYKLIKGRGSVYTSYDEQASKETFINDFINYSVQYKYGGSYTSPGDIVFFYLSTHGELLRDEHGKVCNSGVDLNDGVLWKDELADCVRNFKGKGVRFIGIINACYSGSLIEQFKSNEFNYTAWIASCRAQEKSYCVKFTDGTSLDGFHRTFLKWGWEQGFGKLASVITLQGERVYTGAEDSEYLNLYEAAHYADLIWPGGSSVAEQHFEYVREDVLKKIDIRRMEATPQGVIPVRPECPELSTEFDATLKIKMKSFPDSGIYAVFAARDGIESIFKPNNIWGIYPTFLTRTQFNVVRQDKKIQNWSMPFIEDSRQGYGGEDLREYDIYCRFLGTGGWSEPSEKAKWTPPSDIEWFNNLVRTGKIGSILKATNVGEVWTPQNDIQTRKLESIVNSKRAANVEEVRSPQYDSVQIAIETSPIGEETPSILRGENDVCVSVSIIQGDVVLFSAKKYAPIRANDDLCSFSVRIPSDSFRSFSWSDDITCHDLELDVGPNRIVGVWGDRDFIGTPALQFQDGEDPYKSYFEPFPYHVGEEPDVGYKISYIMNGGINSLANPYSFTTNDLPIELKEPRRTGFAFKGWTPNGGRIEEGTCTNCTFTAQWESIRLTILLVAYDGTTPDRQIAMNSGEKFGDLLPTLTRKGFLFLGWYTEEGTPITSDSIAIASGTLYADWFYIGDDDSDDDIPVPMQIMHTVMFNANGGIVSPESRSVASGAVVGDLPTPTRSGYTFTGWFTASSGGTQVKATTKVKDNVTYYAHWTQNDGGGEGGGQGGGGTYDPTDAPTLFAADHVETPFEGNATYEGWVRNADGSLAGQLTVKAGKAAKPEKGGQSKLTVAYTPLGGRKQNIKLAKDEMPVAGEVATVAIPGIGTVKFTGDAIVGVDVDVQAGKDALKSKDKGEKASATAAVASKTGVWTFALGTDLGYAAFSVTVDKKGKGKLAGTLPDGTKVSVSSQGVLGDAALAIPFAYSKKGSLGFVFWVKGDGSAALSDLTKVKLPNGAAYAATVVAPSASHRLADGDHVFKAGEISQPFTVDGKKWNVPKQNKKAENDPNPTGMKLSFTEKTGAVKGSFTVSDGKAKTKYNVVGVVVGGRFCGSAYTRNAAPFSATAE